MTSNSIPAAVQYQASRMVRLWRPGHGYVHMTGRGYCGTRDWAWRGFRYQARNLLATWDQAEAAEIQFRDAEEQG